MRADPRPPVQPGHTDTEPRCIAKPRALPESDRASIAYELLHSLKPPGILSEDDAGLHEELERRSAALDRDPSLGIPFDEADRRIRQQLKERRQS